jgi:hypothetical protein
LTASEWLIKIAGSKTPPQLGREANNIHVVLEAQASVQTGESNTNSQDATRPTQPAGPQKMLNKQQPKQCDGDHLNL